MTIEFGLGLITCQHFPGDTRSDQNLYTQALTLAADADSLGLDSVWVSEHHFGTTRTCPRCCQCAPRSPRAPGGSWSARRTCSPRCTNPSAWRKTPRWSGGPLVPGMGLGWRAEEFDALERRTLRLLAESTVPKVRALAAEHVSD